LFSTLIFLLIKESTDQNNSTNFVAHAREVIYSAERLMNAAKDYESFSKSFIISAHSPFLDSIKKSSVNLRKEIDSLERLTITGGKTEGQVIDSIQVEASKFIQVIDNVILLRKQDSMQAATQLLLTSQGGLFSAGISRLAKQLQFQQNDLITENKKNAARDIYNEKRLAALIILLLLILIGIVFWKELDQVTRRLVRKSNKEIELLYRQVNKSNDAIYTLNADLKIKSWNKGAENLYGFSQQEAMGKNPDLLLQTEISSEEIHNLIQKVNTEDYWHGELKRITKSGDIVYVDASSTNIRDGNSNINGYVAVSHDITIQKKSRDEYAHLANIVEQSSEAIFSRGTDMRIISWNGGAERLFGIARADAIGKNVLELGFFKLSHTEIREVEKSINEFGIWTSEMDYYHKDGSSFFGAVTANRIQNEKGENTSFYFIVKDISLRKKLEDYLKQSNIDLVAKVNERTVEISKNEKRFRSLIENNNDLIILLDDQFKILYRSPSATRVTGWSNEEMNNADGTLKLHPEDVKKAAGVMEQIRNNPGKPFHFTFRNLHKHGHYLWIKTTAVNFLHDENVQAIV
jgi:PAS domain S-box-containing protein